MGAFVTQARTREFPVPCPCTGTPHENDLITIVTEFSGREVARIQGAMFEASSESGSIEANVAAANLIEMETGVKGWTFVDDNGTLIPFDPTMTNSLRSDIWKLVLGELDKVLDADRAPLGTKDSEKPTAATAPPEPSTTLSEKDYSGSSSTSSLRWATPEPTTSSTDQSKD